MSSQADRLSAVARRPYTSGRRSRGVDSVERVLEAAERMEADLIVVGAHEHGFLRDLLGRSLDEKVVRHADRDVLVVR